METVNIHEAKIQLSRLLEEVQQGRPIVISKAGKPIARLTRVDAPALDQKRRLGFLAGQIDVPEDFDRMEEEIFTMFGGDDASSA